MCQPLYLITDGEALREAGKLVENIRGALEGGRGAIGFVQLREQSLAPSAASDREILALLREIHPLCREYRAKLILNRRVDLSSYAQVDGVHLGRNSIDIPQARSLLGADRLIGYSAHSLDEALGAAETGADYIFLSPIYPTISKPSSSPTLGLEPIRGFVSKSSTPLFALGGIASENIVSCLEAGASGAALIGGLILQPEPKVAAARLVSTIETSLPGALSR